jgi:hypothetical protein
MYLCCPDERDAYVCPVQYVIGANSMAAPFRMPINTLTGVATVAGGWFDFVSSRYDIAGWHMICGGLERIPLFVRSGGVVPRIIDNRLVVDLFPGGSGRFTMVGDDGESLVGAEQRTTFVLEWKNDRWGCVGIEGEGDPSVVAHRQFCLRLHRLSMQVSIAEEKVGFDMQEFVDDVLELTVMFLEVPAKLVIEEQHSDFVPSMMYSREELFKLLRASSLSTWLKNALFNAIWGAQKYQVG